MEISTKMHLPELSTVIHVVRKQIKCILVNERPRNISLALISLGDEVAKFGTCGTRGFQSPRIFHLAGTFRHLPHTLRHSHRNLEATSNKRGIPG